jgi:hypothetical protein
MTDRAAQRALSEPDNYAYCPEPDCGACLPEWELNEHIARDHAGMTDEDYEREPSTGIGAFFW